MDADNASLNHIGGQLDICRSIRDRIEEINNDPPLLVNKGGVIKSGVNAELDELRRIAYSGKDYLLQIQQRESELTGIPSLKIGYRWLNWQRNNYWRVELNFFTPNCPYI